MEKLIKETNQIIAEIGAGNLAEANNKLVQELVNSANEEQIEAIESKINLINMRIRLDMESK